MWRLLEGHSAYDDLDLPNDRFARWHPLNQSLYVGYKVMLAGLLLLGKGDRVAMNSSVETRYPLLDEDVISFCASIAPEYKLHGLTDKWLLRQVAARTLPPRIANRPKTMFRASRSEAFFDRDRPAWIDQLLSPESLRATGWFDPAAIARERAAQMRFPRITPKRIIMDLSLTCVIATQLWHHLFLGGGLCELPTWERTSSPQHAAVRASRWPFPTSGHPTRRRLRPVERPGSSVRESLASRARALALANHMGRAQECQPPRHAVDEVVPIGEARHQESREVHLHGRESETWE